MFDVSGNRLAGPFPAFVAQAIPPMEVSCRCRCETRRGEGGTCAGGAVKEAGWAGALARWGSLVCTRVSTPQGDATGAVRCGMSSSTL